MTTFKATSGSRDHIALTLLHTRPTLHLALAFDPAFSPDIYHLSRCSQFCLVHSTNIYLTAKADIAARKLPPRSTPSRFNSLQTAAPSPATSSVSQLCAPDLDRSRSWRTAARFCSRPIQPLDAVYSQPHRHLSRYRRILLPISPTEPFALL